MTYCPVILEIISQSLKELFKANFILQVYDQKGEIVYEKMLKYDIKAWQIHHNYLVFKPHPMEDEKQYIYIITFDKKSAVVKVKDFAPDDTYIYLGINQELLFYGNSKTIKVVDVKTEVKDGETLDLEFTEAQIFSFDLNEPCRLHGFLENGYSKVDTYILCAVETDDNQLDYTRLYFWSRDLTNPEYGFYQYREVVQRDIRNDPIIKISQVIKANEFQFGVVLRKSGLVDVYWNFTLTNTSDELFTDVNSNFNTLFAAQQQQNLIHEIDISWDARVGFDVANSYTYEPVYWSLINNNLIRNQVKFMPSFTVADTSFFVAFQNTVQIYDIIKKTWMDFKQFDHKVKGIYRTDDNSDINQTKSIFWVLLDNSDLIHFKSQNDENDQAQWKQQEKQLKIEGKILQTFSDARDYACHFFVIEKDDQRKVFGIKKDLTEEVTSQFKLESTSRIVKYLSVNEEEDMAIIDQDGSIIKVIGNDTAYAPMNSFGIYQNKTFNISGFYTNDKVHTIVEDENHEFLFIFDDANIYVVDINKKTLIATKTDQMIQSVQLIDKQYIYCLANKSDKLKREAGFYFQNIKELTSKKEEAHIFKMAHALVGLCNILEYFKQEERLAYMTDYASINIVPVLHRNTINFYGIKKKENYICFLKKADLFIALDNQNILTTYSVPTGKILQKHILKKPVILPTHKIFECDSTDFTYKDGWYYPKQLLVNTEIITVDEKEFFGERLVCDLQNCTAYTGILQKDFHKFSLIEIISSTQVKVHYEFNYPTYNTEPFQRIYISDDTNYMIERLQNQRVFMYKKVNIGDGLIKWQQIRRIMQFPKDISDYSNYNYLFSPNLQYYLDFDKNDECFRILKTETQQVCFTISRGLMNTNDIQNLARKFMWIDNNKIRIVNVEGIEKVLDVFSGLQELSCGTVPMLNKNDYEIDKEKGHYFFDPVFLEVSDTTNRLRRKFQQYFRAYYVDKIRSEEQLYDVLFKVDYTSGRPIADLSFSFFHWKMAETVSQEKKKFKVKRFNTDELKLLLLNIFPKGNTVLHYAYKNLGMIKKFYQIVNSDESSSDYFEIPFLNNFQQLTPLHKCMIDKNYKSADILLENLVNTPLDSHTRGILDILPELIKNDLTSMKTYLDGRFVQTKQIQLFKRGSIQYKHFIETYAVDSCQLWPDKKEVEDKLFQQSALDSDIKLEFLDLPYVHSYSGKLGQSFFSALADSSNLELFSCKSVQAIVDYKWHLARKYTIIFLFIPFIMYSSVWIAYSNVFNGQLEFDNDNMISADKVLIALLYLFSIYFLVNETREANDTDDEPFIPNNFIFTIHSLASLLMWFKFLYFLRIFYNTGYLIRMITVVVWDMKIFLLILFIFYFGFGEAFLRISEASDEEAQFINNYAYAWVYAFRLSIGDTATDTFEDTVQPTTLWILWVISAIITNIVMLNLLVAIIGESFNAVNDNQKQANYQERARIIAENGYLIPQCEKKRLNDQNNYLIVATEIQVQDDDVQNVTDQITTIEKSMETVKSEILSGQESLQKKVEALIAKKQSA